MALPGGDSLLRAGNGDVMSFEDYNRHKEETGVDGIMIGR